MDSLVRKLDVSFEILSFIRWRNIVSNTQQHNSLKSTIRIQRLHLRDFTYDYHVIDNERAQIKAQEAVNIVISHFSRGEFQDMHNLIW